MKVLVINGSPKANYSITLQTVLYLEKDFSSAGIDLSEKYATQITTSKHFYDVTAHRYIQDTAPSPWAPPSAT